MESLGEALRSSFFWLTLTVIVFYLYLKYVVYNFWNQKTVPHDTPSIPLGNIPISYFRGQVTHDKVVNQSYAKYKKFRFHGMYILCEPILVITDPQLIQLVLVKNFNEFYNRGSLSDVHKDPLSLSIIRLSDEKWKRLRVKLTPTFTSGKLKLMYPLIKETCDELIDVFNEEIQKSEIVEIKKLIIRYTVDCITSIAFGFNCHSLRHPDSEVFKNALKSNKLDKTFILLSFFIPYLAKFVPLPEDRRGVGKFFVKLFEDMVAHRRKNEIIRNDFLKMLMQLMDDGNVQDDDTSMATSFGKITELDKLTMYEAVGQSFFFFSAGFETSAATVISCLYELAFDQNIQEKLFNEIIDVYTDFGEVPYEKISEMKYLDLVYQETLRKYPVLAILNRICEKDFKVPDSEFTIKKGTRVIIPVGGLHSDPNIYPEPNKFNPDRFLPENKAKIPKFTYLPFGEGPRQCLGKRLGLLEPKLAIFYLILNYKLSLCENTVVPIKRMHNYFVSVPDDVYLSVQKRNLKTYL